MWGYRSGPGAGYNPLIKTVSAEKEWGGYGGML